MTPNPPLEIVSDTYDGSMRVLTLRYCSILSCNASFYAPKHVGKKYCCVSCARLGSRTRVSKICDWCRKPFETTPSKLKNSKKNLHFCTRSCKDTAQRVGGLEGFQPPHYGIGISGRTNYRERAFREKGEICCKCGYSGDSRMLDVDHVDEDRANNDLSNLQVLCVWCHAIKTRHVQEHSWSGNYGTIVQSGGH